MDGDVSCGRTSGLVWNLTSSYADKSNEASMVSATVIMFILAALFFNLNLFSGLSDASAILDPKVRAALSKALSLFLPVMSYLLSEAKNAGVGEAAGELPLRARLILTWMLVVELLRNKVEVIPMQMQQKEGDGWHKGTVERAGRVGWLGSLVFFNLNGPGRRSLFGILWLLCAAKLVQRVTFTLVGDSSYAYGKNARLIVSYMRRVLVSEKHHGGHVDDIIHGGTDEIVLLKTCRYAVMGEGKLVIGPSPSGYSLAVDADYATTTTTVGKLWQLAETDPFLSSVDQDGRLRRLCLSMALFKLLRRSFEHLPPMSEAETLDCRELIFSRGGLLYSSSSNNNQEEEEHHQVKAGAEELFEVIKDETLFLSEYYCSVVPVALASPSFLVANYLVFPAMVLLLCLVTVVLCGNGNLLFAFRSVGMSGDNNYGGSVSGFGVAMTARCLLKRVRSSPSVFFSTIDLSITFLLFLVLLYEQVWEFVVFLFSNWFLVSLLHVYSTAEKLRRRRSSSSPDSAAFFRWALRRILWVRGKMSYPDLAVKQFSALRSCRLWPPKFLPSLSLMTLPTVAVPKEVKHSIADYLLTAATTSTGRRGVIVGNGKLAVEAHRELRRGCESESVAEVILAWHVATCLFEEKMRGSSCPPPPAPCRRDMVVATTLSKYCAYLVAVHPELLPENQESAERVFQDMEEELRRTVGFWSYYLPAVAGGGHEKIVGLAEKLGEALELVEMSTLQKGASLGRALEEEARCGAGGAADGMWNVLADLWVQLLVYLAPTAPDDRERVMGHAKVLQEGGGLLTVVWALATHTGIHRAAPPVDVINDSVGFVN